MWRAVGLLSTAAGSRTCSSCVSRCSSHRASSTGRVFLFGSTSFDSVRASQYAIATKASIQGLKLRSIRAAATTATRSFSNNSLAGSSSTGSAPIVGTVTTGNSAPNFAARRSWRSVLVKYALQHGAL